MKQGGITYNPGNSSRRTFRRWRIARTEGFCHREIISSQQESSMHWVSSGVSRPVLPAEVGREERTPRRRDPCHPIPGRTNISWSLRFLELLMISGRFPRWVASASSGGTSLATSIFSMCLRGFSRSLMATSWSEGKNSSSPSLSSSLRTAVRWTSDMVSRIVRIERTMFS